MRFLLLRKLRRGIAIAFLVVFLQPLFYPYYTYGLTSGPHQPEYTSYESPGATDMVNLMTGDFSYSLPIVDVPSPEGSFSIPITYNSGIGLDQESSWVGLGWTLNIGAIVRSINEFPDDASGESQSVSVQDLDGVRGWNSHFLNIWNMGWDSEAGHYGAVDLDYVNFAWDDEEVTSLGFNIYFSLYGGGGGGGDSESGGATSTPTSGNTSSDAGAKQSSLGINKGFSVDLTSLFVKDKKGDLGGGYWEFNKDRVQQKFFHKNYWIWLDQTRRELMYGVLYLGKVNNKLTVVNNSSSDTKMDVFLKNDNVTEPLYQFPKTVGVNEGAASDINFTEGDNYYLVNNPATLATDNYSVKAPGISGAITPYRLDIGSVSVPREMTKYHTRYAPIKFKDDYRVPFVYDGSISNSYYHHQGGLSSVPAPPIFYSGISMPVTNIATQNATMTFDFKDIIFKNSRIKAEIAATNNKIPQAAHIEWLNNDEIRNTDTYSSGFLDFLSRQHASGVTASDRYKFRSNFTMGSTGIQTSFNTATSSFAATPTSANIMLNSSIIGDFTVGNTITMNVTWFPDIPSWQAGTGGIYTSFTTSITSVNADNSITVTFNSSMGPFMNKPAEIEVRYYKTPQIQNAIGGYSITSPEGKTFHFSLPVYDYDLYTEITDKNFPDTKRSIISRAAAFANTWLLTAITGPDFVDRNSNGLADDGDWGYWIKFNYGKYQDSFTWRIPHEGLKRSEDNKFNSFSQGKKQLYYLNTVETRSHVALFQKESRLDSRSVTSQSSLRLDEIALVTKEDYKKLLTLGLPNFSDNFNNICWSSLPAAVRSFVNKQCLKRVGFSYNYDLCQGTLNSATDATLNPNKGKLTLKRISVKGKNDLKSIPDYKFEYANNPNYNKDHWDGWGYYNPFGNSEPHTHEAASLNAYGSAWSLTKITNPIGGELSVSYERDDYSSLSGSYLYGVSSTFANYGNYGASQFNTLSVDHGNTFQVGDHVGISATLVYQCYGSTTSLEKIVTIPDIVVTATTATSISFASMFATFPECTQSGPILFTAYHGTVSKVISAKKGGDVRVAAISMKDQMGKEVKSRYIYTNDNGSSSGVVAKEPEYIKGFEPVFYSYPNYPMTPVIYGKVTLLNGKLSSDSEYHTKRVYEFETPNFSMVTQNKTTIRSRILAYSYANLPVPFAEYIEAYQHEIIDRTSKIGSLKGIKVYNNSSTTPVEETQLIYTDQIKNPGGLNNYQGIYSEGVLMAEFVEDKFYDRYNKVNRTTIINYPWTLQSIINTKDGFSSESKNLSWDFVSGRVVEKLEKSNLGLYVKTVAKPAYLVPSYVEMGSKAVNINYKNMLIQDAAEYIYKSDANGSSLGLINAFAQRWNKTWPKYRIYNSTTQTYSDGTDGPDIWRKGASYNWNGNYALRKADGTHTFTVSDEFNFVTPQSTWQYTGEATRFDHFSMPLEEKNYDVTNPIHYSSKMGYNEQIKIAEASNAQFHEIAFSSAEDKIAAVPFFGGEVGLGSGSIVSSPTHTGKRALSVPASSYGFVYKSTGLTANKTYRASAWANSVNGRIYYKLNGGAEVLSAAPTATTQAGSWYRIDVSIPMGSATSVEVGVKSFSGTVVFDDFRFQPAQSVMTCFVYPALDYEYTTDFNTHTYILDNQNLYTKFEESGNGLLSKTFRESIKYNGEKQVSQSQIDYRRFYVNQ